MSAAASATLLAGNAAYPARSRIRPREKTNPRSRSKMRMVPVWTQLSILAYRFLGGWAISQPKAGLACLQSVAPAPKFKRNREFCEKYRTGALVPHLQHVAKTD